MILILPLVFLVLVSDFPRNDGNTLFVLHRVGKTNWLCGQILYFFITVCLYMLAVFVGMTIPIIGMCQRGNMWSITVSEFARTYPEQAQNSGSVSIPPEIYYHMSPGYAAIMGTVLLVLYMFLLTMILLCLSLWEKKTIGILVDLSLVAIGIGLCATNSEKRFWAPMAHSLLGVHYTKYFREMVCSVTESLLYFSCLIGGLIIMAFVVNKKRNYINESERD